MAWCPECLGNKWPRSGRFPKGLCDRHRDAEIAKRVAHRAAISAGASRRWAEVKRTDAEIDWRNWAIRSVARAVRNGWLPDLSTGEYACVDCDGIADRWEHRDYAHVLDVEPVCHACNMRRGLGRMPVFSRVFARHPSAQARGEGEGSLGNRAA
jgi:hypothetical protein